MPKKFVLVKLDCKNPEIKKELEGILSSVEGFHLQGPDTSGPCDLLIMEIGENLQKEFLVIHSLQSKGEAREIFVTSPRTESDVLLQALRAGVKEFFQQPLKKEEIVSALEKYKERILGRSLPQVRGKIFNIIGSKGGVGTTTISVNLAVSLAQLEGTPSVGLIDLNPFLGELPLFLDIKATFDWKELVKNIHRVDSAFLMSIMAKHSSGIYVLPSAMALDGTMATTDVIDRLLTIMKTVFDYIIIDSGKYLNDTSLKMLNYSDKVLLATVLDLASLTNTKKLLKIFQDLGFPGKEKVEILINRSQKRNLISPNEAEKTLNKPIFWSIPNNFQATTSAINQGIPIPLLEPKSELAKNFMNLALLLTGKKITS